jgi:hypothetical protein
LPDRIAITIPFSASNESVINVVFFVGKGNNVRLITKHREQNFYSWNEKWEIQVSNSHSIAFISLTKIRVL